MDKEQRVSFWGGILDQVSRAIAPSFMMLVIVGMVLYLIAQYKLQQFQPFELASIGGLLGGFPLMASFGERVSQPMARTLQRIGGLYLMGAILFVIFGFYQAADEAKLLDPNAGYSGLFKWIYTITFYGGGLSFAGGMWSSLRLIPEWLGWQRK